MSVINKVLRDLDQRSAYPGRVDGVRIGADRGRGREGARWKTAAWLLALPVAFAAGWVAFAPGAASWRAFVTRTNAPVAAAPSPDESRRAADASKAVAAPVQAKVLEAPAAQHAVQQAPVLAQQIPPPVPEASATPAMNAAKLQPPASEVLALAPKKSVAARSDAPVTQESKADSRAAAQKQDAKASATAPELKPPAVTVREPRERAPATEPGASVAAADAGKGKISIERIERGAPSRAERAAAEYRNAIELLNQGQTEQALDAYAGVLRTDPSHGAARQALLTLLLRRGRLTDAQGVLRDGLKATPENSSWAMALARLQVESGDHAGATETLDAVLPYAKNRPEYHAFAATVLQLQGRHKEAIAHYEISVGLAPDSGPWLMGLAVSLEEEKRLLEAREAYQRALATSSLGAEQRNFVERKIGQIK